MVESRLVLIDLPLKISLTVLVLLLLLLQVYQRASHTLRHLRVLFCNLQSLRLGYLISAHVLANASLIHRVKRALLVDWSLLHLIHIFQQVEPVVPLTALFEVLAHIEGDLLLLRRNLQQVLLVNWLNCLHLGRRALVTQSSIVGQTGRLDVSLVVRLSQHVDSGRTFGSHIRRLHSVDL